MVAYALTWSGGERDVGAARDLLQEAIRVEAFRIGPELGMTVQDVGRDGHDLILWDIDPSEVIAVVAATSENPGRVPAAV